MQQKVGLRQLFRKCVAFMKGISWRSYIRLMAILLVLGTLTAGTVGLVLKKKRQLKQAPRPGRQPRTVTVVAAEQGTLTEAKHYLAVVEPARKSVLSAQVTAQVRKMCKDEGDSVEAGETLVLLDDREVWHRLKVLAAQIEEARADIDSNKATVEALESMWTYQKTELERAETLVKKGVLTPAELDKRRTLEAEARGKLQAARNRTTAIRKRIASLEEQKSESKTRLTYHEITSPYGGVVSTCYVEPGDLAAPQRPLIKVEDTSSLKLSFDIPQTDLPAVKIDLPIRFRVHGTDRAAMLSTLFPSLNKARMRRAEARLTGDVRQGLLPGSYLSVFVITDTLRGVTLVPRSSLIDSPKGAPYVFVVQDGHLQARNVEVLGHTDGQTAVKGVQPGELVVLHTFLGWAQLTSGEKVEAIP